MSVGSYFFFEVPRWPSISAVANKCFPELSSRNIYSPDHLHIFSDKSIGIMLDNSNLRLYQAGIMDKIFTNYLVMFLQIQIFKIMI